MANLASSGYRVEPPAIQPGEPIARPPLMERDAIGCAAIVYIGFFFLSTYFIDVVFSKSLGISDMATSCGVILMVNILAVGITLAVLAQRSAGKHQELKAADLKTRREAANEEAEALTKKATEILQRSRDNAPKLAKYVDNASSWLAQAQREYADNAYGPFWDAVEQSAINLAAFRQTAEQLTRDSASYYQILSGRSHNFPVLPITSRALPDPTAALIELQRTVRAGQTSEVFAIIWEHRKTREAVIAGFRNLGEAMSNLRFTVQGSVDELRSVVSSDSAQLLAEQVHLRETTGEYAKANLRKLDEIRKKLPDR
jgi:hypothetical protein